MTRVTAEKVTTGGCLCGALRFTARGEPYRVDLCHCLDCRKNHGALFHGPAIFLETALTVMGDARVEPREYRLRAPEWANARLQMSRSGLWFLRSNSRD